MNDTKVSAKKLPYHFSLEHIMPQTWQTNWDVNSLPVYDENRKVKELVNHNNGDLLICQEVCQNTKWDERYIRARSTELIQILNNIWNFFLKKSVSRHFVLTQIFCYLSVFQPLGTMLLYFLSGRIHICV